MGGWNVLECCNKAGMRICRLVLGPKSSGRGHGRRPAKQIADMFRAGLVVS